MATPAHIITDATCNFIDDFRVDKLKRTNFVITDSARTLKVKGFNRNHDEANTTSFSKRRSKSAL